MTDPLPEITRLRALHRARPRRGLEGTPGWQAICLRAAEHGHTGGFELGLGIEPDPSKNTVVFTPMVRVRVEDDG